MAIRPIDTVTGRPPRGRPRIRLVDRPESFTRTPSGFYVLTDLPDDVETVTVDVDGLPEYLPERRTIEDVLTAMATTPTDGGVDSDAEDSGSTVTAESIPLLLAPAYRFPPGATLVRGSVTADGEPVPGATVRLQTDPDDGASGEAEETDGSGESNGGSAGGGGVGGGSGGVGGGGGGWGPGGPNGGNGPNGTGNTDGTNDTEETTVPNAYGRSDDRGEYALWVTGFTGRDVVDGEVVVDGEPPEFVAEHPDTGAETAASLPITPGRTHALDLAFSD